MENKKITKEILISYFKKRLEEGRDMITWIRDYYGFSDSEDCPSVNIYVITKGTEKEFSIASSGNFLKLNEEEFNELFEAFQAKRKEKRLSEEEFDKLFKIHQKKYKKEMEKQNKESERKILNYIDKSEIK